MFERTPTYLGVLLLYLYLCRNMCPAPFYPSDGTLRKVRTFAQQSRKNCRWTAVLILRRINRAPGTGPPLQSGAKEPSQVRVDSSADGLTYLGEFRVTHYCACSACCGQYADGVTATGTVATEGRTIAVDPSVIPYGSRVAIFYDDGSIRYYTAEDSGSGITGKTVDVFIADHSRARELGVNSGSVYIVSEE